MGGQRGRGAWLAWKAALYGCVANNLTIENSQESLDAAIESLTSDTDLISLWQTSSSACLGALPEELTAEQQPVFLLACIKGRLKLDCALQDEDAALCRRARSGLLRRRRCSLANLLPWSSRRRCLLESLQEPGGSLPGGWWRRGALNCSELLAAAVDVTGCAMRNVSLAEGDTVDRAQLETAISEMGDSDTLLDILEACPRTDLDAFINCWSETAPEQCLISRAIAVAEALQQQDTEEPV
ncbi:uncharacterized protein LOC122373733 [Amphibalanus amphitrite]|uniref:uncharacterized protein LOC122373733 n=1 Tax=Amphibalanus amphitrite TaxID=1232801 RepID=UPI001C920987|nr:uncharacterized protein LOC122373733 [Amphibalanus amphitrite]